MRYPTPIDYVARDSILKLLSDEELDKVSDAQTAKSLPDGDEYLDLEHLGQGVRKATSSDTQMGRVLPKRAVLPATWARILAQMPGAGEGSPPGSLQ